MRGADTNLVISQGLIRFSMEDNINIDYKKITLNIRNNQSRLANVGEIEADVLGKNSWCLF